MSTRALAIVVATFGTIGCSDARTEIIVVVDSDLDVPAELDNLLFDVSRDAAAQQVTVDLSANPLPQTLGLVHEAGPLGPLTVVVTGNLGPSLVATRTARTSFVKGQTLVLRMDLVRACTGGVTCAADETCIDGACRPVDVPTADLVEWTGTVDRLDGAVPPGDDASVGVDGGDCAADGNCPDGVACMRNRDCENVCILGTCAPRSGPNGPCDQSSDCMGNVDGCMMDVCVPD